MCPRFWGSLLPFLGTRRAKGIALTIRDDPDAKRTKLLRHSDILSFFRPFPPVVSAARITLTTDGHDATTEGITPTSATLDDINNRCVSSRLRHLKLVSLLAPDLVAVMGFAFFK